VDLTGNRAVVTGAASGIGAATPRRLREAGKALARSRGARGVRRES
jgi:NAD(P)-dependent dehydrogenase (short-subunit alcohol dehydrogenase family)